MEHFQNAKVVRLLSHHGKYLIADDDDEDAVQQHRSGASLGAKWEVELVEDKTDVIRLKSSYFNRYLAASRNRFRLGATGRKVVMLPLPPNKHPHSLGESVEWQPIGNGPKCVKLRTAAGTFLRVNGLVNTVTHGNPHLSITQDWVLWEVDMIEMAHNTRINPSPATYIDHFKNAKVAPLLSSHDKYLTTNEEEENPVRQHRSLAASDDPAFSSLSQKNDDGYSPSEISPSIVPPALPTHFSTSLTTKITATAVPQSFADSMATDNSAPVLTSDSSPSRRLPSPDSSSPGEIPSPGSSPPRRIPTIGLSSARTVPTTASSSTVSPPLSNESSHSGRLVFYYLADNDGTVDDTFGSGSFEFQGSTAEELIHNVENETGLVSPGDFILCTRDAIDDKLCRVRLDVPLPSDRVPMIVFIVHPNSKVAKYIS